VGRAGSRRLEGQEPAPLAQQRWDRHEGKRCHQRGGEEQVDKRHGREHPRLVRQAERTRGHQGHDHGQHPEGDVGEGGHAFTGCPQPPQ
jgi:hypothetical protein